MLRQFIILFVITFGYVKSDEIAQRFVNDFIVQKNLPLLVVFGCWDLIERVHLCKSVMQSDIRISYIPIPREVLVMKSILAVNYYKLGVVLDLDCPQSENVLDQFSKERLPFNESYHWLLMSEAIPTKLLRELPLTVETELTMAVRSSEAYTLYDVYNPSYRHGGVLNVTDMGNWDQNHGLKIDLTGYKYKRRGNLNGLTLNSSIAITHPPVPDFLTYISNPIERHLDTMHRFNYALVRQLCDYYNFTINLMRSTSWGYLINGTFNGMLGDMIAGRVDIGATPLRFKPERIDVAEFTVQTWIARPAIIFRHPKKNEVRNGFLRPFTETVWWFIALVGVVGWLFLWLTVKLELHYNEREPISTLETLPASETALITIAALCQQGLTDGPGLYAGRIVFISIFLWGLMLYQFYSASVVGSLLAEPPRYITTLQHLTDSSLQVGIEDIAYNYDHFATSTDPVDHELHKRKIAPDGKKRKRASYYTPEEGLRKVKKGGFAFQVDVATAYKIITDTFSEDEICDLAEIQLFPPQHTATVTSKHSPFKKMVTYGMRHIMECGMGDRLRHIWQHERPRCPASHSSKPNPVSIEEFSPAMFLLLMGLGAAAMVVLAETVTIRDSRPCCVRKERRIRDGSLLHRVFVMQQPSLPVDNYFNKKDQVKTGSAD